MPEHITIAERWHRDRCERCVVTPDGKRFNLPTVYYSECPVVLLNPDITFVEYHQWYSPEALPLLLSGEVG